MTDRDSTAARVEPREENDPFCTCPSCGLLGTHYLRHTEYPPNERVEGGFVVMVIGRPPEGTPAVQRQCVFCDHQWLRRRDAEETS
ncbi:hypothetical protein EV383_4407 [Pseudonocardia sediminis]|uniref:Uncharacterized protein n=1 Tax=Pseudonocardia sediminis TaxID=1397368 RepID=A0A4Q7UZC2_PSEST|nr:hypothetical protein [Pseudonocardia sediminis]RZT87482.1 hypothetical protein EV383_4407 [Pseudonocardia sediminis]